MNGHFVVSDTGITLVAGGPVDRTTLRMALKHAPMLVAADGGADRALRHGAEPIAVIGDLDSISDAARTRLGAGRLHHVAEQETTDLDKCLRSIKARFILAIGVTGGRSCTTNFAWHCGHSVRTAWVTALDGRSDISPLAPSTPASRRPASQ